MKVHKLTICIIDHDDVGEEEIRDIIENTRYPNHCISPDIKKFETRDIGEWDDDHPLNQRATCDEFFADLFFKEPVNDEDLQAKSRLRPLQ